MSKLKNECRDKVLSFILSRESTSTIKKLIDCTWLNFFNKKTFI